MYGPPPVGQKIFGPAAEGREPLFQLKALAVGALDLGGVSLVSADPNGGQARSNWSPGSGARSC